MLEVGQINVGELNCADGTGKKNSVMVTLNHTWQCEGVSVRKVSLGAHRSQYRKEY